MRTYTEVPVSIAGESDDVFDAVTALTAYAQKLPKRFAVTIMIHIDSSEQPIPGEMPRE